MSDLPSHYIDSCVFSGFLNGEAESNNFEECESVIRAAEQEIIKAFTSAFTMGEVVYIKTIEGRPSLSLEKQEEIICNLFYSEWLNIVNFDRDTAEINRFLLRQYGEGRKGLKPYDSVHLATAIKMKVDFFDTIDQTLINRLPQTINYPPPLSQANKNSAPIC